MKKNGLKNFDMHASDAAQGMLAAMPAMPQPPTDPEVAARRYVKQALGAPQIPMEASNVQGAEAEFKSLGVEEQPLTGTRTVKFRQQYHKIPVYGSLVTVELEQDNSLVALNSAMGEPIDVDPLAKLAPAEVVRIVAGVAKYDDTKDKITSIPRLNYYFDVGAERWHLAYIVEDVVDHRSDSEQSPSDDPRLPEVHDFVVDAHDGKVIATLPRTMRAAEEKAPDALQKVRTFLAEQQSGSVILRDAAANLHTHDFEFQDAYFQGGRLPGKYVQKGPIWDPAAVSAHANAADVLDFLRKVLKRDGLDNQGGAVRSSINCLYGVDPATNTRVWKNAAWYRGQMVYGQHQVNGGLLSYAVAADVVAHELTHGLTEQTARLEYKGISGALNESYSDIFGVVISNMAAGTQLANWDWELGEDIAGSGVPLRDLSDPAARGQPAHMNEYRDLPANQDNGGVHINSGIHNKAAYNVFTAKDGNGLLFTAEEIAILFFLTLTQQLSRTSGFADSRRSAILVARTLFRNDARKDEKVDAVAEGFKAAGIV